MVWERNQPGYAASVPAYISPNVPRPLPPRFLTSDDGVFIVSVVLSRGGEEVTRRSATPVSLVRIQPPAPYSRQTEKRVSPFPCIRGPGFPAANRKAAAPSRGFACETTSCYIPDELSDNFRCSVMNGPWTLMSGEGMRMPVRSRNNRIRRASARCAATRRN